MKKISALLIGISLLAGTACKKESTTITTTTPTAVDLVTRSLDDDGSYINRTYNSSNQLVSKVSYSAIDSSTENFTYTYSGKVVNVTEASSGMTQKFYLNSKGTADSGQISYPGLIEISIVITYNAAGEPVTTFMSGSFLGSAFEQTYTSVFSNGNMIQQTTDDGTTTSVSDYTFYLDKVNSLFATDKAEQFMGGNKNLIKKTTNDDGTFTSNVYEYDTKGRVTKQTETDETSASVITDYTWK